MQDEIEDRQETAEETQKEAWRRTSPSLLQDQRTPEPIAQSCRPTADPEHRRDKIEEELDQVAGQREEPQPVQGREGQAQELQEDAGAGLQAGHTPATGGELGQEDIQQQQQPPRTSHGLRDQTGRGPEAGAVQGSVPEGPESAGTVPEAQEVQRHAAVPVHQRSGQQGLPEHHRVAREGLLRFRAAEGHVGEETGGNGPCGRVQDQAGEPPGQHNLFVGDGRVGGVDS
ncbi:uncharacterized protein LOC123320737 [Coccinella septempunctata]|uniref:uncharacterized protein LOC123320737 n=1 Tax=Coccinella septempunctata TaxID=41139 RepID=UPI001D060616|nr:uncharacterized protein LOC123320737 [Coccinella septempunctata]